MVALSVLAIIITSVFRLYLQSVSMLMSTDFDLIAPLLSKRIISELQINDDRLFNRSGSFEDKFENYSWESKESDVDVSALTDSDSSDMKEVSFTKVDIVIKNEGGRTYKTYFYADKKNE